MSFPVMPFPKFVPKLHCCCDPLRDHCYIRHGVDDRRHDRPADMTSRTATPDRFEYR